MKVIAGLGNPGHEYDATRHNVGWWVIDRLAYDWGFPAFEADGLALVSEGRVGKHDVLLLKPTTFMNRSGAALAWTRSDPAVGIAEDLLVVVDDATREVGQVRFRRAGSSGGHNGLESVEAALGTDEYARLRLGVGRSPGGVDLASWVLAPFRDEDEDVVVGLLPELSDAVRVWMDEGIDQAMDRYNR